jgi:hypothetical protein
MSLLDQPLTLTKNNHIQAGKFKVSFVFAGFLRSLRQVIVDGQSLCYSHDCSNGDIRLIEPQA